MLGLLAPKLLCGSRYIVLLFLLSALLGCQMFVGKSYEIQLTMPDPDRIRFSGKGAGAGMMLSASMGAMGIAVGVAIDEGIAKDIDKSAKAAGFDAQAMVHQHFSGSELAKASPLTVTVEQYGFKLVPGSDENVQAYWKIQLENKQALLCDLLLEAPKPWPALVQIKQDGVVIIQQLANALAQLDTNIDNVSNCKKLDLGDV
ncbi:hypothetical protein [Agaribacterium haliotis]|uniref:hypothetical protein n=1 Tax=Agaribacterium haliotis TaxID=2013869 RepID=UPI000BB53A0C|nr:hypothetical protein [Agaribacterium haliotis]